MNELSSEFLIEMNTELEPAQELGTTPIGTRAIVYTKGGSFAGPRIKGSLLPGGGDWLLIRTDGVWQIDVRQTFRTDDDQLIYVSYRGLVAISPEVLQRRRAGESVDPSEYYFRTTPVFETSSTKYDWLNRLLAVGVGSWLKKGEVHYEVYAIL